MMTYPDERVNQNKLDTPAQIQQKAFFSSIKDGLIEIQMGFCFIFIALMVQNIYFVIGIFVSNILWKNLSKRLKERYIYPRIGFVEFSPDHKEKLKRFYRFLYGYIILTMGLLFLIVYLDEWKASNVFHYLPLMIGMILLGKSLYYSYFSGEWKKIWIGIFDLILGISFIIIPFSSDLDHTYIFAWIEAGLLFFYGEYQFHHLIRKNSSLKEM